MEERLPSFSLAPAQIKVSSKWLLINAMLMICSLAITAASAFRSVSEYSKMKFYGSCGLGVLIVYLTAFICCYVFAVVSCALGVIVDACFKEICDMGE